MVPPAGLPTLKEGHLTEPKVTHLLLLTDTLLLLAVFNILPMSKG